MLEFIRKKRQQKERKEIERLKKMPHEEMFRALREEGDILSIKEIKERGELTPEIKRIWDETVDEIFTISLNFQKVRWLLDESHLYFLPYKNYNGWEKKLRVYLDVLASLNSVNSFGIVNSLGFLVYLNPLGEPVSEENDDYIKSLFEDFYQKAGVGIYLLY